MFDRINLKLKSLRDKRLSLKIMPIIADWGESLHLGNLNPRKIFYPVISGLLFSFMLSAIIGIVYYKNELSDIKIKPQTPVSAPRKVFKVTKEELLERNIFKTKMLEGNLSPSGMQNPLGAENQGEGYTLIGVFKEGKKPFAFLEDSSKVIKVVKQGETTNGLKLVKVNFDSIDLLINGQNKTLKFPAVISTKTTADNTAKDAGTIHELPLQISISKAEVMNETKDMNKLLTSMVIAPYYEGSTFQGFRFEQIKDNSLLYKIGLRQGDILKKINGTDIESPQQAISIFSKINELTSVNIDIIRETQRKSLFVDIRG